MPLLQRGGVETEVLYSLVPAESKETKSFPLPSLGKSKNRSLYTKKNFDFPPIFASKDLNLSSWKNLVFYPSVTMIISVMGKREF